MTRFARPGLLIVCIAWLCAIVAAPGCDAFNRQEQQDRRETAPHAGQERGSGKVAVANLRPSRAATTQPALNNVTGTITFTERPDMKIHVTGEVRGLTPDTEHGFHIHEKGDLSAADFSSAGPHYNPEQKKHGGVHGPQRHVGDLGNIKADRQGVARVDVTIENATLRGQNAIVDRALIVHAGRDDLKTDPAGDSGARIAAGVIEMKR